MDEQQQSPPAPPPAPPEADRGAGEAAFDVWLNRSLHALYDSVTAEPIPPELLRLIAEDSARKRS